MTKLTLFKTSALSGMENLVKLLLGLAIIKMIAFSYGPNGMALFGQFQNMYAATIAIASGMLVTGGVRYTAQYHDAPGEMNLFLNEAMFFSVLVTSLLSLICLSLAQELSIVIFARPDFAGVFRMLSVCLIFMTLNIFTLSVLNGMGLIRRFILSKILLSLFLIAGSVLTIWLYDIKTFFYVYILINAAGFLIVAAFMRRIFDYNPVQFWANWKAVWRSRLFSFWLMALAGVISTPLVMSVTRYIIVNALGIESAGYWDAITRFTELYLVIITGAMLTYYIPKLGRCHTVRETKNLVYTICGFAVAVSMPITLFIYFFRHFLVRLVLDDSFMVTTDYFGIALIGSIFKIVSWVFSYYLIAKSKVRAFLFFELVFGMLLVLQTWIMTPHFGLYGVFYASVINSALFCLCVYIFFVKEMRCMGNVHG
ncbi:O-antigen translocase [Pseudomonas sp. HR96]|uniref:O-antigen translocase n=1 Tax=Pseudomonas sp. HR96 TaxID=1027966 RepID=UPI002A75226A|nr:O-antigen translocase [Pseudomonas sp. HR96]WPO98866.1 O-antigen translocase [Pseudomonas sp. HR96]